jgi:hypothetical protein
MQALEDKEKRLLTKRLFAEFTAAILWLRRRSLD